MLYKIVVFCLFIKCLCGEDNYKKAYDIPEGSDCTWEGQSGRCTNLHKCQSAQDALKRKMHPLICSFQDSTPIVCCTDCLPDDSGTTDADEYYEIDSRFNYTSKAKESCSKYLKTLNYPCKLSQFSSRSQKGCYEVSPLVVSPASKSKRQAENKSEELPEVLPPVDEETTTSHGEPAYRNQYPHMSDKLFNAHPLLGLSVEDFPAISRGEAAFRNQYPHMTDDYPFVTHPPPAISQGKPAFRNQYPHMALLGFGDDVPTAQWLCGGSVISENFILTAAHCVSSPSVGPVKFVALGILSRSDPPQLWQTHNVKRAIRHPEYHPPSKYNDIALLETENTISFGTNVLPACLHLMPEADETAEATGWGATGHRQGLADILQTVKLQRYDEEKCSQLYPVHRHLRKGYDHSSQMCYGDTEDPKDTCEGDSGGPLQVQNEALSCAYTVLGVTSYGRQCGISAGSGMYTRVYHYVPWIEDIVWP